MMVRKKDSKNVYAMKTLRKAALVKRNQVCFYSLFEYNINTVNVVIAY